MKAATKILIGSLTLLVVGAALIDCKIYVTGFTLLFVGVIGTAMFSPIAEMLEDSP